jgi:hypothetical protein
MSPGCWIDVFDLPAFGGERRRFFGPIRVEVAALGLGAAHDFSIRVGRDAALWLRSADGHLREVGPGEAIDTLDATSIQIIEVKDRPVSAT